ncbi:hypothetical protein Hypma_000801 [Hypsizygus marmoreus]|uniref:Uncharacterized protein n=1 Tax=Hypsizygus marmoreus TaxID=39966 RepID=A0A369JGE4_HYPMA|nr:hypothetical protein Hypma_000801 [Hypsizygus marmoreus]
MPLVKADDSHPSPPDKLPHTIHNKPSMPIEIPSRRRPILQGNSSPDGRSLSPDLIFEMSPVSSNIPSPSHYAFGFQNSPQNNQEQFLYSFPTVTAHYTSTRRQPLQNRQFQTTVSQQAHFPTSDAKRYTSLSSPADDVFDGISCLSSTPSTTVVTKTASTTKITGFTPATLISTQRSSPVRSLKTRRLSPPPRSSSYSSSPWILPGKSDVKDGESASFETEPTSFEFERHLMRRIEKQNPLRFRGVSLISTIRG